MSHNRRRGGNRGGNGPSQLPEYTVPKDLEAALTARSYLDLPNNRAQMYYKVLKQLHNRDVIEITESHYIQLLKLAVYLEEYHSNKEMKKHEMSKQTLDRINSSNAKDVQFRIDIDDLDEERAWLRPSDFVDVTDVNDNAIYTLKIVQIANTEIFTVDESGR